MCKDESCAPKFVPAEAPQGGGGIESETWMTSERPFGVMTYGDAPSRPILLAEAKIKIAASPVTRGMVAMEGLPLPKLGVEQVFPTAAQIPTNMMNVIPSYTQTQHFDAEMWDVGVDRADAVSDYLYGIGNQVMRANPKKDAQDEDTYRPAGGYPPIPTPWSQDTQYWTEYVNKLYPAGQPRPIYDPGLPSEDNGWNERLSEMIKLLLDIEAEVGQTFKKDFIEKVKPIAQKGGSDWEYLKYLLKYQLNNEIKSNNLEDEFMAAVITHESAKEEYYQVRKKSSRLLSHTGSVYLIAGLEIISNAFPLGKPISSGGRLIAPGARTLSYAFKKLVKLSPELQRRLIAEIMRILAEKALKVPISAVNKYLMKHPMVFTIALRKLIIFYDKLNEIDIGAETLAKKRLESQEGMGLPTKLFFSITYEAILRRYKAQEVEKLLFEEYHNTLEEVLNKKNEINKLRNFELIKEFLSSKGSNK